MALCRRSQLYWVTVVIRSASTDRFDGTLCGDVLDDIAGLSVLSAQPAFAVTLMPGDSVEAQLCATISRPNLWHFDHLHLYRCVASLGADNGEVLYSDEVRFGVRAVGARNAQLHLNGEPVRLVGVTRHADSPEHGLAETIT